MMLPKYRAWDYNDKKMWKVVAMSEPTYDDCEEPYIKVCEFDKSPMDKETDIRFLFNFDLMQFTGLYDKNGKEIYEGDIVIAWSAGVKAICEVKWGRGRAGFFLYRKPNIAWNLSGGRKDYNEENVEVIGNIFEHKHLLEG